MKRIALLSAAVCLVFAPVAGSDTPEVQTLTGEYQWSERGASGDLEAIFKPTGEGTWKVDFHFEFRGQPHIYSGTAEGSLSEGPLSGTVLNEDKRRTFKFTGSFEDGQFSGTHSEMREDGETATGTMSLSG